MTYRSTATDRAGATRRPAARSRAIALGVVLALTVVCRDAGAVTFSARLSHRGFVTQMGDGTAGILMPTGWFRHAGDPTFVYRVGEKTVAGVWLVGPDATVVRDGRSETTRLVGRIVPSWDGGSLRLSIQPAGVAPFQTDAFARGEPGPQNEATLTRGIATLAQLEGSYRAAVRTADGREVGWIAIRIDPEGATVLDGDLPAEIPPSLAAAAAAAADSEVTVIYQNLVDVAPLAR